MEFHNFSLLNERERCIYLVAKEFTSESIDNKKWSLANNYNLANQTFLSINDKFHILQIKKAFSSYFYYQGNLPIRLQGFEFSNNEKLVILYAVIKNYLQIYNTNLLNDLTIKLCINFELSHEDFQKIQIELSILDDLLDKYIDYYHNMKSTNKFNKYDDEMII